MAERKRVAPYAPASAVSEFFDHIRYVKTPAEVDSALLQDYGLSRSQSFPTLSTLKYLGIVDDKGIPTPAFRALQTGGDEFKDALRDIVEKAYGDLFGRLDVSRDSRDKIMNFFARNSSPATAERATALFLDLCGEAGIETSASKEGRQPAAEKPTSDGVTRKRQQFKPLPPPPPSDDSSRVVVEIIVRERELQMMNPADIKAVFDAAATIETARYRAALSKPVQTDQAVDGENNRSGRA